MSNEKCLEIIEDLEKNLANLESETDNILASSQKAVAYCKSALSEIREVVHQNGFKNVQDEIKFFKKIKPKVFSKLIYHSEIFLIESKRPNSSNKVQRKFLIAEINKIHSFTNDNLEFYQYYRCNTTNLDDHFFLRSNVDIRLFLGNIYFMVDEQFSTSHDHTVAYIQAYDILTIYLKKELGRLDTKYSANEILEIGKDLINSRLFWTGNKIALIELIYAIHSTGAINKGVTDIKIIAGVLEKLFHIELGDLYHAFAEIRMRKKDRTKYIDNLKLSLIQRMDDYDQK